MRIQFVATKVDSKYEVALVVDGKFRRAVSGESLNTLFSQLVGPFLAIGHENGVEVQIETTVTSALPESPQ